jgi:nicotinamide-nucleotide amidase
MDAEIIAVGSEMLGVSKLDTNSLYLTAELNKLGIEVVAKAVIGDDRNRLAEAVRLAMSRSQIVILSGGLGPTEDDVTREAVAMALDRKLLLNDELLVWLQQRFAAARRTMAEINRRQAFVIEGATILPNDRGTAPGQWVEDSGAIVMLLPGPPHELRAMFEQQCLGRIARIAPKQVIRTLFWRVTGMGESDLDQLISPVYKKYENPVTTILAASGDIQIHLRARCGTVAEADALLAEVAGPMELLLGDRLYSRNGDPLEVVVGELLHKNNATVSVAESATGGMLGERFTSTPGSSEYFAGGFITYNNTMKAELLGVPPELLKEKGAVSREVAEAMAIGARRRTGSTYALSITGVAGPGGDSDQIPKGTM